MIYLDHHAATPLAPGVREAMAEAHERGWANPASAHGLGRAARALVEAARRSVASTVNVQAADLIFTAGGTEACNLAVLGLFDEQRPHVITSELEHPAVLAAVELLAARGAVVERLACEPGRPPTAEALARALRADTGLVALQWVNHETGNVAPVADYAELCRDRELAWVVDASQALGKLPCDLGRLGASAVVLASSKIGGPGGAAALWVARGRTLRPRALGGAQERGRRAGTPDVAALCGFGAAARTLPSRLQVMSKLAGLRDRLERTCVELGAHVNGRESERVATVTNVSVLGWRGAELVAALDVEGLCAASGAACSSGLEAPSPVIAALYPEAAWRAGSALRLSLGPETTGELVHEAAAILTRVLRRAA